jgi:hypothetical protein
MKITHRAYKTLLIGALVIAAVLAAALSGCALKPKPSVVGTWRAADTAGKVGSLSDLTLRPDGQFYYAGKNALGGTVRFGGRYRVGVSNGADWIRLDYDAYPGKPTVWFYRIEGTQLTVSTVQGNLSNGAGLVFTRQQ